ncbi:SAP domain-containing protein [Bradyrhizobium sp. CAR08]
MYVRQLAGRQDGMIVEMDAVTANAAIEQGTAARPTDDEIQEAGYQAENRDVEVQPRQVLLGYRVEPSLEGGGWDLFDAGGVKLNKEPFHNRPEAMDAAENFGRRARGLPEKAEVWGNGGSGSASRASEGIQIEKMTAEQLQVEAARRGIDSSKANKKADWIALLKRDDEVQAAIVAGNYDALTVDELKKLAADRNIDITGKTAQSDLVDAIKAADSKPLIAG